MNGEQNDNSRVDYQAPTYEQPTTPPPYPAMPAAPRDVRGHKSPALATVLSSMPGLGQVYVGYYQQGFINVAVIAICISILSSGAARGFEPLFGVFLAFFWMYNMIDANRRAHHYNRMSDGVASEDIPEDFPVPGATGSIPVGIFLVIIGTLFFMDLKFGMSMEWVEDWWPMILIGGGVWLIVKARNRAS